MTNAVEAWYKHGDDQPVVVHTPEEVDDLIDRLLEEPFENSVAAMYNLAHPRTSTGYPGHELLVAINSRDGVGGLAYMGEEGNRFSKGQLSKYEEVCYYYMGNDREFPRDSEISLDQVREAAREFLANGGQCPTCVTWQPYGT